MFFLRKIFVSFISLLWVYCFSSNAQEISFSHLDVENGLSQNSILSITQDSRGFMWFGTTNGLNRFDSKRNKIYQVRNQDKTSLYSNNITCLLSDSHKTLWIGTTYGLNRYIPEKDNFVQITEAGKDYDFGIGNNAINCLFEDKEGFIWAGTNKGIFKIADREKHIFHGFDSSPELRNSNITAIFIKNNILLAGTDKGLFKVELQTTQGSFQKINEKLPVSRISNSNITSIAEDKDHQVWIGTLHEGLSLYNTQANTFVRFIHNETKPESLINNNIRQIICDDKNRLWIGTQEGLSILDVASKKISSYKHEVENPKSLSQNSIYSIYIDNNNSKWIGTFFGGVNKTDNYSVKFKIYHNIKYGSSLSNNVISSIVEDEYKNLWIGTEGGGLNYFNRNAPHVITYANNPNDSNSLGSNLVKVVYRDKAGIIWSGTHGGGLNVFNPATKKFKRYLYNTDPLSSRLEVLSIREDNNHRLWVGTNNGLLLFNKNGSDIKETTDVPITNTLHNQAVRTIMEDHQKNLWIGTFSELYFYDSRTFKVKKIDAKSLTNINVILEGKDDKIWIGSETGGLYSYDTHTNRLQNFSEKEGLSNNNVLGLLEDDKNNLWISTGSGLAKFNTVTKVFKNYFVSDGIAGNVFNRNSFFKSSNQEFFFGGYSGLISFYPDQIEENPVVPGLVLTGLRILDKTISPSAEGSPLTEDIGFTEEIQLKYSQNIISIDFAVLNFIKPEKNKYAYKLEGFDNKWNYTYTPVASYTNLPPGKYTFFVKGSNNDGVWSNVKRLVITVNPPLWKTWWAYVLYALIIVLVGISVIRYFFLQELLKRDRELTKLKLNFFTNISHEIKTHLSLIKAPVEKILFTKKENDDDFKQLQTIKQNSDSLHQLIIELMDFRKAETGNLKLHIGKWNIVEVVHAAFESFDELALAKNIITDFIFSTAVIEIYFDKEQFKKVIVNLLSNAYKFTPTGGCINVIIEDKKDSVEIKVIDNGKGIAPDSLNKLFDNYYQEDDYGQQNTGYGIGLALSKSIVELHHGSIKVSSVAGEKENTINNTCFTVSLLKGKDHFKENEIVSSGNSFDNQPEYFHSSQIANGNIISNSAGITSVSKIRTKDNKKYTVLLVEDNADLRNFIRSSLEPDFNFLEAINGIEGLETALENIPDIIISDVMMPLMDGLTFCRKIKSTESTSHIPVILLTAKATLPNQINGLEVGADIYLTKPFSLQVLLLHLQNLLHSREKLKQLFFQQFMHMSTQTLAGVYSENAETPKETGWAAADMEFMHKITQSIEDNIDNEELNVNFLAKKVAMSPPVMYKKLAAITGVTVNDFVKTIRLKKAGTLLAEGKYTVYEVAYMVGFGDRKYFSKEFKKFFGKSPTDFILEQSPS